MYSPALKYLDSNTKSMDLKWNNQDVTEVSTFSFNTRGSTEIFH